MRVVKAKLRMVKEFEGGEGRIKGGESISRVVKEFEGGEGKIKGGAVEIEGGKGKIEGGEGI